MALAGHALELYSSLDDITYTAIDGINDVSFGPSRDLLESTDFMDTTGARTRFAGLKDGTISLSGDYESGDTGQSNITTKFDDGASCHIKILWNGAAGHKVECKVESYEISASVDGKVEFTATCQFTGVPSAV